MQHSFSNLSPCATAILRGIGISMPVEGGLTLRGPSVPGTT